LRHFYDFEYGCGGSGRVNVVEVRPVGFGVVLRYKAYDRFIGPGVGKEALASFSTYCQRHYSARVGDGISNRQDADDVRQFEFVVALL
ncbi:unnamed protein product, partial [marine sediment metagenome]